ncbi:YybS family protein [Pontibacillus litoralis]|uniref:DUF2232 domain-containing protein n=1 Tax=Pontibacillus litoralis JSM 072002 TaxID=1385512 RepID=A0A0A5HPZ1_9BACI|nr:DUF2232 domain-containing protein [Pontibacillus litoralis]KGX85697.1 hypothetical protein N784_08520 [Pontibacillus litoralis JSM 072002]
MNQTTKIKEGIVYAAIYIILLLMSIFIPGVAVIGMVLLPLPFMIYTARFGWKSSVILAAIIMPITLIVATVASLPITLLAICGGIALGTGVYLKRSSYEIWAQGTVGYVLGMVLFYVLSLLLFHINWVEEIQVYMQESIEASKQMIESISGTVPEEQLELVEEQLYRIIGLLPSFMAIMSIGYALMTLWLGYKLMNLTYKTKHQFPPVRNMSFPKALIWYHLIAIILTWINADPGSFMDQASQNVYTLTGFLMTLQGLTFLFAFADYKKITKAFPIGMVVLTFMLPFLLLYPLMILGIIDLGFSLRARFSKK